MRYTWKRAQWLMGVFVWCCQPPLLFPGLLMWLIHGVFKDTNRLLRNVWPKIKVKGRVCTVKCVTLHIRGKRKGVCVWGLQGTLMMDDVRGDHKHGNPRHLVQPLCMLVIATFRWFFSKDQHTQWCSLSFYSGHNRIPATCPASLCPLFYLWPCAGMCWAQLQQENYDIKDQVKDLYSTSVLQVSMSCSQSGGKSVVSQHLVFFVVKWKICCYLILIRKTVLVAASPVKANLFLTWTLEQLEASEGTSGF